MASKYLSHHTFCQSISPSPLVAHFFHTQLLLIIWISLLSVPLTAFHLRPSNSVFLANGNPQKPVMKDIIHRGMRILEGCFSYRWSLTIEEYIYIYIIKKQNKRKEGRKKNKREFFQQESNLWISEVTGWGILLAFGVDWAEPHVKWQNWTSNFWNSVEAKQMKSFSFLKR